MTAPILKYPGAKWRLAKWIISHFPPHDTYVELFAGSASVFFNKKPSPVEIINDIDKNITTFFRVLRERPVELAYYIQYTPWSRDEYLSLLTYKGDEGYIVRTEDELENARRFLVRMWMGRGAKTSDRTGWRHNIQRKGSNVITQWNALPERILLAAERLKLAQIECQPAVKLIERCNRRDVLIYADPPYLLSTRSKRLYAYEMGQEEEHIELISVLKKHTGPVLLSGYNSSLYDDLLSDWMKVSKSCLAEAGLMREEVLWINPVAAEKLSYSLF